MKRVQVVIAGMFLLVSSLGVSAPNRPVAHDRSAGKGSDHQCVIINISDMDIREALRLLAAKERINIALSPDVHGQVSLGVYCESLSHVLRQFSAQVNARYCFEGSVIRIYRRGTMGCGTQ